MFDALKTIVPIFGRPENYTQMLAKLAGFSFWQCVIGLTILKKNESFEHFVESIPKGIFPSTALPEYLQIFDPIILLVAVAISFLAYFFQLHDQLQKPFGIRARFDRDHIFLPLAKMVNKGPTKEKVSKFMKNRNSVMRTIFYSFASSTKSDPVVDKHDIIQALWLWSIFWAVFEGAFFFIVFSFAFAIAGLVNNALLYVVLAGVCIPVLFLMMPRLSKAALAEIEQIASNGKAKAAVRKAISALLG